MTFIAGAYTVTYDAVTVGQIESGINLEWITNKQLITGDNEALTSQDAVFQGKELFVEFVLMEYDLVKAALAFWPYATSGSGATLQGVWGTQGTVGRLDVASSITRQLIFTVVAGTTASLLLSPVGGPLTLTVPRAILVEDFPVRIRIGPELRTIRLRMRAYPDSAGVFFTKTDPS